MQLKLRLTGLCPIAQTPVKLGLSPLVKFKLHNAIALLGSRKKNEGEIDSDVEVVILSSFFRYGAWTRGIKVSAV